MFVSLKSRTTNEHVERTVKRNYSSNMLKGRSNEIIVMILLIIINILIHILINNDNDNDNTYTYIYIHTYIYIYIATWFLNRSFHDSSAPSRKLQQPLFTNAAVKN